MSDREAIEAVKNGDKERFAELVERHQKMVYGIAWSRLGDAALSEDAAQETFIKAFRYLVALRNPEKFPAWLGRIARNVSTSIMRTRVRELDRAKRWGLEQSNPGDGPPDEDPLRGESLRKLLGDLPDTQRECLVLFYLEGKSIREGASALGISEAAMKTRLHRARFALRERLEGQLETSLAELGPKQGFSAGVMVSLPTQPWLAGGIGGASLLGNLTGKFVAPLSFMLWIPLFQSLFIGVFFGWLGKLEQGNLRPGPGTAVRERQIESQVFHQIVVGFLALVGSAVLMIQGGPYRLYDVIILGCFLSTCQSLRVLRVNQNPFMIGQLLFGLMILSTSVLIRFFGAPYWTFFVGLLLMNIVLYQTNKSRPTRHDYSLFLRHAMGALGPTDTSPERISGATRPSLKAFARFLGNRFLVQDYKFTHDGIRLTLAAVKPGIYQYFDAKGGADSVAYIGLDGQCEACISRRDQRGLRALTKNSFVDLDDLEGAVARALQGAFQRFQEGKLEEAATLLQAEQDAQIFETPTALSREHKTRGWIAIVGTLVVLCTVPFLGSGISNNGQRAQPVSQAMAREAMAEWSRNHAEHQWFIHSLLESKAHPSADFIGEPDLGRYRDVAARTLLLPPGAPADIPLVEIAATLPERHSQVAQALHSPKGTLNLLDANLYDPEELNDLGVSAKALRAYLTVQPVGALKRRFESYTTARVGDGATVTVPTMSSRAHLVEFLAYFECLDFLEGDLSASDIAAHQVGPNWQRPDSYKPIDTAKAAGLFNYGWCDFSMTWSSLRILQLLGELDSIDRDACVQGILRFHRGKGVFRATSEDTGIHIRGSEDDTFYAMESLHILNALDEIPDFNRWRFKPMTSNIEGADGKKEYGVVAANSLRSWAYQERLEELRGD